MYAYARACSSTPEVGERQAGSDGDALSGGVGGEGGGQARERARAAKGCALWRRCGVVVQRRQRPLLHCCAQDVRLQGLHLCVCVM